MEAIRSSETSVHTRYTRRHIQEEDILLFLYLNLGEFCSGLIQRRHINSLESVTLHIFGLEKGAYGKDEVEYHIYHLSLLAAGAACTDRRAL
jgi:hypothetical protein